MVKLGRSFKGILNQSHNFDGWNVKSFSKTEMDPQMQKEIRIANNLNCGKASFKKFITNVLSYSDV